MREIKFRAWDKDDETMLSLGQATEADFVSIDFGNFYLRSEYDCVILMQYTGLKDKNGVEIYEGDIVRGLVGDDWVVEYFGAGFTLRCTCHYPDGDFYQLDSKEHEVIGNIYENPELLKAAS